MGKGKYLNKPCPCRSGKKYKKCCINKTREASTPQEYSVLSNSIQRLNYNDTSKNQNGDFMLYASKPKRQNNHYVPIKYQKRFLLPGQKTLHCIDLKPYKDLPNGRRVKLTEKYNKGPGSYFHKKNLYTTNFFGMRNEDIETLLFGKMDNNISAAIDGLVANDPNILHKYFQDIFVYIDAQKLRTIKGLDWIRSNYFQLTKDELLLEMQFLRTMHCTMWIEGVMEIVSAEESDIKFIISDHPVTIYNPACPPESEACKYPNDPSTAWKASQTIFPLDLNHCLVLTNLEYATSPNEVDPVSSRTNPRFFSQTITRWDTVIRERKLKAEEVRAFNYIIKNRARKYIAAGKLEWLYPEKTYSQNEWGSLYKILLPPKDGLYQFGGEIYVGGKDGGLAWYQDAFGRRHTSRENENDPVRKYSIKERNEILNNAIYKIFGFDKGINWDDFRKELTDDKIRELYRVIGHLWNPDTELTALLSKPNKDELKALYHGSLDPRVTPLTIMGYSLYVDKIIMYSPFLNPRTMNEKYSPYENPHQYMENTIKNVNLILGLMPLIDSGIVEMIPDPCDFNLDLKKRTYKMAEARMKYRSIDKNDTDLAQKLMRDDMKSSIFNLPPDILKYKLKEKSPNASEEEIEDALKYIQKKKLDNPLASLQPIGIGEKGGQMHVYQMSGTLEMALYLAQITGSFVYTDIKHFWKEYKLSELKKPKEKQDNLWETLAKALDEYNLIMFTDPDTRFWHQIKEKEYLKDFIDLYRDILTSVQTITNPVEANIRTKEYVDRLKGINLESIFKNIEADYKEEYKNENNNAMTHKVKIPASYFLPIKGISSNTVTQILLTYGINMSYWKATPFGVYLDLNGMKSF